MTGPVNSILNTYPVFLQVRISWRRIEELSGEITELQNVDDPFNKPLSEPEMAELAVHDVQYQYCRDGQGLFSVGPFRLTFRRGTITFITGGNGSGKTTLGKLITGLYTPASGFITIDNQPVDSEQLGGYFSAIFNDFYLFKRLYGIDCSDKQGKINELLNRLQLSDKVTIQDDRLSTTTDLSTGQKKRLALLLTYLEDKPICLFDEWAADQDPEYRHYFYHVILPEMKKEGKCIIAITHDDRFFHLADELIKLEQGKMHEAKPLLT
ncbi:ABC transporter ATP-binding protein YojI [compost metagenome]